MSEKSNLWYFENVDLYKVLCPHLVTADKRHNDKKIYKKSEFIYFPNETSPTILFSDNIS